MDGKETAPAAADLGVRPQPGEREEIYLDWSATTPPHASVVHAMGQALTEAWGNPSSIHGAGRRARVLVEEAREALAGLLGVHPRDVLFTSGATEANNLALRDANALATSRIEHPSIVRTAEALEKAGGLVVWLEVDAEGRVTPESVGRALDRLPRGATVAVAGANHETGVVHPVRHILDITNSCGADFHVDLAQVLGKLPLDSFLGARSFSVSAHKIRGPKGIGALAWIPPWLPRPMMVGGAQERGLRAGTVDPAACAGLGAALRRAADMPATYAALAPLRDRLESALMSVGAIRNGAEPRLPHVTNLSFPGWKGAELVAALDLAGILVSSGSACSAGTAEPSAVVRAFAGEERAESAVRFSLGETTTPSDVDRVLSVLLGGLLRR